MKTRWTMLALLGGAIACRDAPVAPRPVAAAPSASTMAVTSEDMDDTTVTSFTIDPRSATWFTIGKAHALYIPANAVCDLATSSYGPTQWDVPCTPMASPLVITAKSWKNAAGLPQVDFSPSLRFNPAAAGQVTLFMRVSSSRRFATAPALLYCATVGAPCVNEALSDPTLLTQYDVRNRFVYRRIKHFSGYNVSSGRADQYMSDF